MRKCAIFMNFFTSRASKKFSMGRNITYSYVGIEKVPDGKRDFAKKMFCLQKMKFMFFEGFVACKKWNSCFLRIFKLAKNEIHVFWGFLSLQKLKFMFFEVFKLAKNEIHVFWGFLSLQKMKFMFFEVF